MISSPVWGHSPTTSRAGCCSFGGPTSPVRGLWSLPGGRVEPGENDAAALVREMAEETGLVVQPGDLVGRVRRGLYEIADYRCRVVGGSLRAGDDALDARWCDAAALVELPLVPLLLETLRGWDALPR